MQRTNFNFVLCRPTYCSQRNVMQIKMYGDSKIHIDQCDHITLSHLERWIFMSVAVKILYSIQSPIQLLSFNG